jgi:cell division protein FtsB
MCLGAGLYTFTLGRFFVTYCLKLLLFFTFPLRKGLIFLRKQGKLMLRRLSKVGKGRNTTEGWMHMRRKNGKRKTGIQLLLLVVLVMCGLLTFNKVKAEKEEQEWLAKKASRESQIVSEKERQSELEEQKAYQQTNSYIKELAREAGMVMPDEIVLREKDAE